MGSGSKQWSPKLKQPSDDHLQKSRRNEQTGNKSARCPKALLPNRKQMVFRRFNSVAFLSRVCLWAVPPLPGTGHSNTGGERKLKQPLFGRQLEAVSKTAVDSQIGASWTGLEAVYGQCPLPGTGHSERGSESLNSLSLSVSTSSGRYRQQMGHDGSNVGQVDVQLLAKR